MSNLLGIKITKKKSAKPGEVPPNKEDRVLSIDVKTPNKIPYQITRVRNKKRVVIKVGTFRKGQFSIAKAIKNRIYYPDVHQLSWLSKKARFVKEKLIQCLLLDVFYAEPINPASGVPEWSQEVEDMYLDSKIGGEIEIAEGPQPFKINRTTAIAMIVAAVFCGFFGLSMNAIFHLVPGTVVHWNYG